MIFPQNFRQIARAEPSKPPSGVIRPPGDPDVPMIFPQNFVEVDNQVAANGPDSSKPPSGVIRPPGDPDVPMIFPQNFLEVDTRVLGRAPDSSKPPSGVIRPPGDPDVPMIFPQNFRQLNALAPDSSKPPSGVIRPPGDPDVPMIFPQNFRQVNLRANAPDTSKPPSGVIRPPGDPDVPMIFPQGFVETAASTSAPDSSKPPSGVIKPPGDPDVPMIFPQGFIEVASAPLEDTSVVFDESHYVDRGWDNSGRVYGARPPPPLRSVTRQPAPAFSAAPASGTGTVEQRNALAQLNAFVASLPSSEQYHEMLALPSCMMEQFLVAFDRVSQEAQCRIGGVRISEDMSALRSLPLEVEIYLSPIAFRLSNAAELCSYLMSLEEVVNHIKQQLDLASRSGSIQDVLGSSACLPHEYAAALTAISSVMTGASTAETSSSTSASTSGDSAKLGSSTAQPAKLPTPSTPPVPVTVASKAASESKLATPPAAAVTAPKVVQPRAAAAAQPHEPSLMELRFGGSMTDQVPEIGSVSTLPSHVLTAGT